MLPTHDTGDLIGDRLAFTGGIQSFRETKKPVSIAPETIDTGRLVLSVLMSQFAYFRLIFADAAPLQAAQHHQRHKTASHHANQKKREARS